MTKEVSQTLDALENVDGVGERFCRLDTDSNSSSVAGAAVDSCTAGQLQLHPQLGPVVHPVGWLVAAAAAAVVAVYLASCV